MSKKEKITLLPKLRFPEFSSTVGWDRFTLEKVADRITEKVGDKQLVTLSISAGTGFVSQTEKFSRDISGKQYHNYICLRKGDFSYNKGNSKTFPQGCIYELLEYDEAAVPNAFISFHFKDTYVPNFYKGYFENNFHGKQLKKFITSGARMDGLLNIKSSDFFSIVLPTPKDKEEQQKIADCLSSLDDLIAAEDKKLSALRDHKKGLMQKLFPVKGTTIPEIRFEGYTDAWNQRKLGEVVTIKSGWTPSKFENGSNLFIKVDDLNSSDRIQGDSRMKVANNSSMEKVREGSIIFPKRGAAIMTNKVRILGKDGYLDTNMMALEPSCEIDGDFLYTFICYTGLYKIADTSSIPQINNKHIVPYNFTMPSIPEQEAIGIFFSNLDKLVTAQSEKIEALKAHKKGLMQGLFPSIEEVDV